MGMLGMLFGGKAQLCEETWEPFSMVEDKEDYCAADWAQIITQARDIGADVEFTTKGIKISHGKSEGLFRDAQGGVREAQTFLSRIW